jgi:protein-S-isoprenylcysteine O-methyltransferase Ste14
MSSPAGSSSFQALRSVGAVALGYVTLVFAWMFVQQTHKVDGPLWFESGAALALVVGALAGAWAWKRRNRERRLVGGGLS